MARAAQVSTAVVSYVVNGGPRPVAPATRRRVEQAIGMLGYRRDPIAGALSAGRSPLVGLLVPDVTNGFFGELALKIERTAARRGLVTMVGNIGYEKSSLAAYLAAFCDLKPHAVFVASPWRDGPGGDTPVVHLHAAPDGAATRSVVFDNRSGGERATRHLVRVHGIRDVHCFTPGREGPTEERVAGWRAAMARARRATAGMLHRLPRERVETERAVARILRGRERPRAIFATSDELALAVVRAAANLGIRIPDDLALVGFDGIREAVLGSTRLTTVRASLDRLAEQGFALLDAEPAGSAPRRVVLPVRFHRGETCGCTALR